MFPVVLTTEPMYDTQAVTKGRILSRVKSGASPFGCQVDHDPLARGPSPSTCRNFIPFRRTTSGGEGLHGMDECRQGEALVFGDTTSRGSPLISASTISGFRKR